MTLKYKFVDADAKKVYERAEHVFYPATTYSAGVDLLCTKEVDLWPGEATKIHLGVCIEQTIKYWDVVGLLLPRSSLFDKKGIFLANSVGVIDFDYRGELIANAYWPVNDHQVFGQKQTIRTGEKIAQIIFVPRINHKWEEVEDLNESPRGEGGFGSTDK